MCKAFLYSLSSCELNLADLKLLKKLQQFFLLHNLWISYCKRMRNSLVCYTWILSRKYVSHIFLERKMFKICTILRKSNQLFKDSISWSSCTLFRYNLIKLRNNYWFNVFYFKSLHIQVIFLFFLSLKHVLEKYDWILRFIWHIIKLIAQDTKLHIKFGVENLKFWSNNIKVRS